MTDVQVEVGEQPTINKIVAVPATGESYKTAKRFEVLAEARRYERGKRKAEINE